MVNEIKFDFIKIVKPSPDEYQILFGLYFRKQEGPKEKEVAVVIGVPTIEKELTPEKIEEKKLEFIKFFKSCAFISDKELLKAYGTELPGHLFE